MATSLPGPTTQFTLFTAVPLESFAPHEAFSDGVNAYNEGYTLFDGACNLDINGTVTSDCPTLCQNHPELYWNSLPTLHNCFVTPYIAANLTQASLQVREAAEAFGIEGTMTYATRSNIAYLTSECFSQYYTLNSAHLQTVDGSDPCNVINLLTETLMLDLTSANACFQTLCTGTSFTIDSDLGGIGIFLSYYVQLGISVLGISTLRILDSWAYNTLRWPLRCFGKEIAERVASNIQENLGRHKPALVASMLDFHKVQCFFMVAVQAAALIAMAQGTLNVNSLGQEQLNFQFLQVVAANCYIPVTFTLWYLRRFTKRCIYNYILTLLAFSLSAATVATAVWQSSNATFKPNAGSGIEACSSFNPTSQCPMSLRLIGMSQGLGSPTTLGISSAIMILLTCEHIWDLIKFTLGQRKIQTYGSRFKSGSWQRKRVKFAVRSFRVLSKLCISASFIVAVVSQGRNLLVFIGLRAIDTRTWGIGQIVGLTTFLPGLIEFIYLDIAGMESGSEYRLPSKYRVTRVPTEPIESEEATTAGFKLVSTNSSSSEKGWPCPGEKSRVFVSLRSDNISNDQLPKVPWSPIRSSKLRTSSSRGSVKELGI